MATVRDILNRKGSELVSVDPDTSVLDAARLMNQRAIGSVLVMEDDVLCGIFTERDILTRVVVAGRDPGTTPVGEVMTTGIVTCEPDTPLAECMATMTTKRLRRLPVVGVEGLMGVITSGDVLAFQVADQAVEIQYLNSYIHEYH